MATTHKCFNTIDKIEEEGITVTDPDAIKTTVQEYYQNLYKEIDMET